MQTAVPLVVVAALPASHQWGSSGRVCRQTSGVLLFALLVWRPNQSAATHEEQQPTTAQGVDVMEDNGNGTCTVLGWHTL